MTWGKRIYTIQMMKIALNVGQGGDMSINWFEITKDIVKRHDAKYDDDPRAYDELTLVSDTGPSDFVKEFDRIFRK